MSTFAELLASPPNLGPGDAQSQAQRSFPVGVAASHLRLRKPCTPIPNIGAFVVVGVASYSPKELELLDEIDSAHQTWDNKARIEVFDVLDCQTMVDFEKYIPGVGVITQSPVVAVWVAGRLAAEQTGLRMVREVLKDRQIIS